MQPFDDDKYDKRFEDIYKPALNEAGLEAYRVDRDPHVEITIDAIENGICDATICFADITEKNENVWFELGYAFANQKRVVLVCSKDRQKFPFDIRHRNVITYSSDSSQDFERLKGDITERSRAYLKSQKTIENVSPKAKIGPIEGLSTFELYILAELASAHLVSTVIPSLVTLQHRVVRRESCTEIDFSMSILQLKKRGYIEVLFTRIPHFDDSYKGIKLTKLGWDLLDRLSEMYLT